jgi:hypothetical protein
MTPAQVRVRVQAVGGKSLGPHAHSPVLMVTANGETSIWKIPNGSSGTVVPQQSSDTTPFPIVVQPDPIKSKWYPKPGTYWLEPPADGESDVVVSIPLKTATEVQFRVEAFNPNPVYTTVTQKIEPGESLLEPGLTIPVPGLLVAEFTATPVGPGLTMLEATVQMMCGCPVTKIPTDAAPSVEPYWPSTEFEVTARFASDVTATLHCVDTNTFAAVVARPAGPCEVVLTAYQPSTRNTGGATLTLP